MARRRSLEGDCMALLSYVYNHRDEPQSYTQLAESTGIPRMSLTILIRWTCSWVDKRGRNVTVCGPLCNHSHASTDWALQNYGLKWGYHVKLIGEKGKILDVERFELRDYIVDYYPERDMLTMSDNRQQRLMLGGGSGYTGRDAHDNAAELLGDWYTWKLSKSVSYLSTVSDNNPENLYARIVETGFWPHSQVAFSASSADSPRAGSSGSTHKS